MSWIPKVLQGGRKPTALELLKAEQWHCRDCKESHHGMFALAAFAPDAWQGPEFYEENAALRFDGDFLSEDFCVLGGTYFMVRARLEIPVLGMDDSFSFGAWTTLSKDNFEKYISGFDTSEYPDMGPWPGWLCNTLENYVDNDPLAIWAVPQSHRQRPLLFVQDDSHPLAIAQNNGILPERVLEIYDFYGHALAR